MHQRGAGSICESPVPSPPHDHTHVRTWPDDGTCQLLNRLLAIAHEVRSTPLTRQPTASRLAARPVKGGATLREATIENTVLMETPGDRRLGMSLRPGLAEVEAGESHWTSAYYRYCYCIETAAREATELSKSGATWLSDDEEAADGYWAPPRDEVRFTACGRHTIGRAEPEGTPVAWRLWSVVRYDYAFERHDPWRPWSPMSTSSKQIVAVLAAED